MKAAIRVPEDFHEDDIGKAWNYGRIKPGHKWIRRTRIYRHGKAEWRHYYAKDEVGPAQAKHQQKLDKLKKRGLSTIGQPRPQDVAADIAEFTRDYEKVGAQRRPLSKMNAAYITSLLPGDTPPKAVMSARVRAEYHNKLTDFYGDREPDDLNGEPMSPFRALEIALQRLPPAAQSLLTNRVKSVRFIEASEDSYFRKHPQAFSRVNRQSGTITIAVDRAGYLHPTGEPRMGGGLFPVEVIAHALGHLLLTSISRKRKPAGYKGPWGDDWLRLAQGDGGREPGVTVNAESSSSERFSDSFAAAILFPGQLAACAPKTYDFFRRLLGPEALPPRQTSDKTIRDLSSQRDALMRQPKGFKTEEVKALDARIYAAKGLDALYPGDERLTWWRHATARTHIQRLLREAPPVEPKTFESIDPRTPDKLGDKKRDRFFEWSVNGRTVYFRIGPYTGKGGQVPCDWDPADGKFAGERLNAANIKEVWDEDGNLLDYRRAFLHLTQDDPPEGSEKVVSLSSFRRDNPQMKESVAALVRFQMPTLLPAIGKAAAAGGPKQPKKTAVVRDRTKAIAWTPVEITQRDYERRSGTPVLKRWRLAGADAVKALSRTPLSNTKKRADLLRQIKEEQPWTARRQARLPSGRLTGQEYIMAAIPDAGRHEGYGPHPIPNLTAIVYENVNPDGSRTKITVRHDDVGNYFIADPVLRELLTPNGEAITSGDDLSRYSIQAAQLKRRAWASVDIPPSGRTEVPLRYHVQVEWDGRGSPRILGDQWKQVLGIEDPRLEDLLTETGKIKGPVGLLDRGPLPPRGRVPKVGERVMLKVRGAEIGRRDDREILAQLVRITRDDKGTKHFVFTGVAGSGFGGRRVVRVGDKAARFGVRRPIPPYAPKPLEHHPMVYLHHEMDPRTGRFTEPSLRILLPTDGSVARDRLLRQHGGVEADPDGALDVDVTQFAKLRQNLPALVLTTGAESYLAETMNNLSASGVEGDRWLMPDDVTPKELRARGATGLKAKIGRNEIIYGQHQREMLSKFFSGRFPQRMVAWHAPGTGKTVESIVAIEAAIGRRDPDDPTKPHPLAPKRVCIAAPTATLENWEAEAGLFGSGAVIVGAGTNHVSAKEFAAHPEKYQSRMVVVGHEYWTAHAKMLKPFFDGLVVDEIHKGTKKDNNDRMKALRKWGPDMKMTLFLSGTPITKNTSDILPMVQVLTNNQVWGSLSRKDFEATYLMPSPTLRVIGQAKKGTGPRNFIKPEYMDEVAGAISEVVHIASAKHVVDKVLPAIRVGDTDQAEMVGIQAALYNSVMSKLNANDRNLLTSGNIASEEELEQLISEEGRQAMNIARQYADNPAYKPGSVERAAAGKVVGQEQFVTFSRTVPGKKPGEWQQASERLKTPDPKWLASKTKRGPQKAGRWPTVVDLGEEQAALYGVHFGAVLGTHQYAEIAGQRITQEQKKRMKEAGWPTGFVANPAAGPPGLMCRGYSERIEAPEGAQAALDLQRSYAAALEGGSLPDAALADVAEEHGVSLDEASAMLTKSPVGYRHRRVIREGGIEVEEGFTLLADQSGGAWKLYRPEDWNYARQRPNEGAKSTDDAGMRAIRDKQDLMSVKGNAKAEAVEQRLSRFWSTTGPGPDGERQAVLFAHNVLTGTRLLRSVLRRMGLQDVNEALPGFAQFDPTDPRAQTGPPAKRYFVTYGGESATTGKRALNSEIFRKVKDRRGRDTKTSRFVFRCMAGRGKWREYAGDPDTNLGVQMSRWSPKERDAIKAQFTIQAPEAYVEGPGGTTLFFKGNTKSRAILKKLAGLPDPTHIGEQTEAVKVRRQISKLKQQYAALAKRGATADPPVTAKQAEVFNNCVAVVASDAAKEGLNWGNSSECIEYDVPQSPMDEYQRIARSARMLPKVVSDKLRPVFDRIKAQEKSLFAAKRAGGREGLIAQGTVIGERFGRPMTVSQMLDVVALRAAQGAEKAQSREELLAWDTIRGRADTARTFGAQQALAALQEFRTTRVPGTTTPVLAYKDADVKIPSPLEGTYAKVELEEPTQAIQRALSRLPESDRRLIAESGYKKVDGLAMDAAEVYLTLRADEILKRMADMRPAVERELRSSPVGSAVTDTDIANRLVDGLSPEDRAILKTKKYLVNVYRVTPSAVLPSFKSYKETRGPRTVTRHTMVGYEKQYPIMPEAMARAVGRSRSVPVEALMRRIEEGVKFRGDAYYAPMAANTAGMMSVVKAWLRPAVRI